jgi:hypothetical protein
MRKRAQNPLVGGGIPDILLVTIQAFCLMLLPCWPVLVENVLIVRGIAIGS